MLKIASDTPKGRIGEFLMLHQDPLSTMSTILALLKIESHARNTEKTQQKVLAEDIKVY
jgi:hypothetical protein